MRLALPAGGSLRQGLVTAFSDILMHARNQASAAAPILVLHEYRKAVRRARALLRLLENMVGVEAYGVLSATLREIHRATSAIRDRQVVSEALDQLKLDQGASLQARSLYTSVSRSEAPDSDRIAEVLQEGAARMVMLPRLLDSALPAKVTWRALDEGLRSSHQRARRKRRQVARGERAHAAHDFRKRVKELVYQVELLAPLGGKSARKTRRRLARLAQDLSGVADFMVLRRYLEKYPPASLEPEGRQEPLDRAIEQAYSRQLARALAQADKLLASPSGPFAHELTRAVRQGRKHARKAARKGARKANTATN